MQALVLYHLSAEDLPADWAQRLPEGQRFTITITAEKPQTASAELLPDDNLSLFGMWKDKENKYFSG